MNWLKTLYEVLGSQYPRLSIIISALIGAMIFGAGWWLIGKEYEKEQREAALSGASSPGLSVSVPNTQQGPTLSPVQERLLELLAEYQKKFATGKLVIIRKNGALHFDNDPDKGAEISLVRDLYGSDESGNAIRFEQLMESMPGEYVRFWGEARLDNPFVVSVTDAGMKYLRSQR